MSITEMMNGEKWKIEPFSPGHYEEYKILDNGKVEFLNRIQYHKPGDKPSFGVYVPWESMQNIFSKMVHF